METCWAQKDANWIGGLTDKNINVYLFFNLENERTAKSSSNNIKQAWDWDGKGTEDKGAESEKQSLKGSCVIELRAWQRYVRV